MLHALDDQLKVFRRIKRDEVFGAGTQCFYDVGFVHRIAHGDQRRGFVTRSDRGESVVQGNGLQSLST